jgi:hypothetical protein
MEFPSDDIEAEPARSVLLRDYFLGWQCRIREHIFRKENGRPSKGISPTVQLREDDDRGSVIIPLLFPKDPNDSIKQFPYLVKRTHDPQFRFTKAIQWLSSTFYQLPDEFSGVMTGLFSERSKLCQSLIQNGECPLHFDFQQQSFKLPCSIQESLKDSSEFQFTYWHNRLFNSYLSSNVKVLSFHPKWDEAEADL